METIPGDLDGVISLPSSLSQLARRIVFETSALFVHTPRLELLVECLKTEEKVVNQACEAHLATFSLMNLLHPNPYLTSGVPYQVYAL